MKLTDLEAMILKATRMQPGWLNCSGHYIGEVLALGLKGLIESRLVEGQLQVRARQSCQVTRS